MRTFSKLLAVSALTALWVLAAPGEARAQECSAKVSAAFKGQLIVTANQLDLGGDAADVIASIRKKNLTVLKHDDGEDGPVWGFYFTAFMNRTPGAKAVSLDFYTDDSQHRYAANKRLEGIDPHARLLQHNILISEDDGLDVGKRYLVKLTASAGGHDVVLATTKLTVR
ncbi:MAG TPA: hypothetical protein VL172_19080 [Kofleriaceae bacterium]|nr:hypothetical protein [Kofleriaceae bacterium]